MKTLTDCENIFEAQLIVGRLENEGILAVVLNEHVHNIWPFNSSEHFASVQVAVNEKDYDQAIRIISVDQAPDEETEG